MTDSTSSRLIVSLIIFWTFLTIFSNVFANYLDEPIATKITDITKDMKDVEDSNLNGWDRFMSDLTTWMEETPFIKLFSPLVKLLTFQYSDNIHPFISVFLNATLLFTYYAVWSSVKK